MKMASNADFFQQRRAGVLLHPTSLPNTVGNGDLGEEAYRFVDFLSDSGISLWQMLPLGAPHEDLSPYQCQSVHAANPLLISLDNLVKKSWLVADSNPKSEREVQNEIERLTQSGYLEPTTDDKKINDLISARGGECSQENIFTQYRYGRLREARFGFEQGASSKDKAEFKEFIIDHAFWLEDYALFRALQTEHVQNIRKECLYVLEEYHDNNAVYHRLNELRAASNWCGWSPELRDRHPEALAKAKRRLKEEIAQHLFEQFVFFKQWLHLKDYAHQRGVYLFGDLPIFVAEDSVDVWTNPENFLLDDQKRPTIVTGVPPDYFSATGQRWGNPHYNWEYMQSHGFDWWLARLKSAKLMFDVVRIDHFRGFEASWAIQSHCETAIDGYWMKVPGHALFEAIQASGINLPLVAEDLGIITDEVVALRDRFSLPGMNILQFAFDSGNDNPYLLHNHCEQSLVYTGTHDNNTTLGWFYEAPEHVKQFMRDYLQKPDHEMPWSLMEKAFTSVSKWAIVPMQDVMSLDGQHRMNVPGVEKGNWRWRFDWNQIPHGVVERLRNLVYSHGRNPS